MDDFDKLIFMCIIVITIFSAGTIVWSGARIREVENINADLTRKLEMQSLICDHVKAKGIKRSCK